uniref:KH_10 domain-containing protein n=1 Tax=Ascaris lumbricoides TaxID=6252 RepID=A0A0M3HXD3_ASCLU
MGIDLVTPACETSEDNSLDPLHYCDNPQPPKVISKRGFACGRAGAQCERWMLFRVDARGLGVLFWFAHSGFMGPGMLGKNRGGITSRPYPERPNIAYPPPSYYCRPSRYDISSSFYHGTQKNAKVHEMMFRLGQIAYEQLRRSGAALLRQMKLEERIKFLERYPLSMDVTLNIEVPCEDHFDMIAHTGAWCQEDSIARIMNETGVLILFPCGRVEADGLFENVNTVKLKGPLVKVEEARRRLRVSVPTFCAYLSLFLCEVFGLLDFAIQNILVRRSSAFIFVVYLTSRNSAYIENSKTSPTLLSQSTVEACLAFGWPVYVPSLASWVVVSDVCDATCFSRQAQWAIIFLETMMRSASVPLEKDLDRRSSMRGTVRFQDLCPISIAIPLKGLKSNMTVDQAREQIEVAIEDKRIDFPRIEIMIMQKAQDKSDDAWACVVRGSMRHEDEICEACVALYALLFEDSGVNKQQFPPVYTTSVDIPLPQQLSVLGIKGDLMLSLISSRTNAFVCHWNVINRRSNETPLTIFYFKGTVRAIVRARKYIQGLLPVQLSFDVDDDDLIERIDRGQRGFTRRDDVFGVNITIKASRIEGEQLSEDDLMRVLEISIVMMDGGMTADDDSLGPSFCPVRESSVTSELKKCRSRAGPETNELVQIPQWILPPPKRLMDIRRKRTLRALCVKLDFCESTPERLLQHLVLIESEEHNLANVYATRRALFRANALDEPVVVPNDYDFFDPLVKQLALANSKLIFERQQGLEESTQMNPLPAAVCMPLSTTSGPFLSILYTYLWRVFMRIAAALPLDHWQAGSLRSVTVPMWTPAVPQPGSPATCRSVSAMNSASCPLHSRGVIQAYVMAGMDPNIPSNNSSMYSGVSSVMPPSTDSSSSRTAVHLPSNPAASTGIVAVAPPAATAHHFINSVASSHSKQSNVPVSVPVAQFVDSFRTCGQTTQQSVPPACITPAAHLDAPQMIQV